MKSLPGLTLAACAILVVVWASSGLLSAQNEAPAEAAAGKAGEAAQPANSPAEPDADDRPRQTPDALFESARKRLVGYRSIKARIVEEVALPERRFKATGSYLQGTNLKLRLEYKVTVGGSEAALLEVCDGYVLWTRHTIKGEPRITRRDVRQILSAATSGSKDVESMLIAELGLGGLPALLASIQDSMALDSVRREVVDDKPFQVIEGRWSRQFLDAWQASNPRAKGVLPPHIPDRVRIYFNEKTLFPQRIVYMKQDEDHAPRPLVTLDFLDIVLNGPVNDDEFYFVPPDGVFQEDITNLYLERLKAATTPPSAAPR